MKSSWRLKFITETFFEPRFSESNRALKKGVRHFNFKYIKINSTFSKNEIIADNLVIWSIKTQYHTDFIDCE